MKRPTPTPADLRRKARETLKRKALRDLKRAKTAAAVSEVELTEWEGEFLGAVETRVQTYGRAFADPEKGGGGSAFSVLQLRKLKEISAKIKGEAGGPARKRGPFGRPVKKPMTD